MNCIQCGSLLDTNFVTGGSLSTCSKCHLKYVSVAYLMKRSDTKLIREFWEYTISNEFPMGPDCPHCRKPLCMIPLISAGVQHPILGCKTCYHLILKEGTMSCFENENEERKVSNQNLKRKPDIIEEAIDRAAIAAANATKRKWILRLGSENGKEYSFSISFWGLALALGSLFLLRNSGGTLTRGLLTIGCAFGAGLCIAKLPGMTLNVPKQENTSEPRNLRDLGPQANAGKSIQTRNPRAFVIRSKK